MSHYQSLLGGCMTGVLDLAALEDGALSGAGRARLARHLAVCPSCRAVHDELAARLAGAWPDMYDAAHEGGIGVSDRGGARGGGGGEESRGATG